MKLPRGSRSDIGFRSAPNESSRVVDDPHNYAKELPVRKSRNPKPQYKMPLESLELPSLGILKATGRGATPKKVLTPRRKGIISRFILECSQDPGKYGRIGSLHWIDELASQINTPGTGRLSTVSHSDIRIWLDHADIVDLYENLKETQSHQLQPVEPVAGTSGGVAKHKEDTIPLPPKKRARISSPSTWDFISPRDSPASISPGLLASTTVRDPLICEEGDNRSPLSSTPSISPSGEHQDPVQPLCYVSSLSYTARTEEDITRKVTIIKKKLSDDELHEEAAAVAGQLTVASMMHQQVIVENSGPSVELTDQTTEQEKKDERILPLENNVENQDAQQNMSQYPLYGMYNQIDDPSNQERNVVSYESFDSQVQQEPHSSFCMQEMRPLIFEHQVSLGATNYNNIHAVTQGQEAFNSTFPLPSPDEVSSFGPLNLVQNRDQNLVQSNINEESRYEPISLDEALRNLHNSIDSVRVALNCLYSLNYQARAPTAMSVFGHIVDSMISFYANYMRSNEQ